MARKMKLATLILLPAVAIVAIVAIVAFAVMRASGNTSGYSPVWRITNGVALPGEPVKVAVGGGFIWVALKDGESRGSLVRVEPRSGQIVGQPAVP